MTRVMKDLIRNSFLKKCSPGYTSAEVGLKALSVVDDMTSLIGIINVLFKNLFILW